MKFKNVLYIGDKKINVLIGSEANLVLSSKDNENLEESLNKNKIENIVFGVIYNDNTKSELGILAKILNIKNEKDKLIIKIKGIQSVSILTKKYEHFSLVDVETYCDNYEPYLKSLTETLKLKSYILPHLMQWFTFEEVNNGNIADIVIKALCILDLNKNEIFYVLKARTYEELFTVFENKMMKHEKKDINLINSFQNVLNKMPKKGEKEDTTGISEYIEKIEKLNIDDELKEKLRKEISKLKNTYVGSAEYSVTTAYLDEIIDIPWNKYDETDVNLKDATEKLDEHHYGLEEAKEKVIDYLADMQKFKMKDFNIENYKNTNTSILCLVGPPGVGKTSFANSIARAINRKYVKIALGGINDEAEIRGHRKTYVGAMPGKIIRALKYIKTSNPLILLDEIDKLGIGKGDPSAALLEVLDPEQNKAFVDNYIDHPYDLSKVFFICTANDASQIPRPLYDRMSIVYLDQYSLNEKIEIAKKYILPNLEKETEIKLNGFTKPILKEIIELYTREAGVRELKNRLSTIYTKIIREKLEKNESINIERKIKKQDVFKYLGREKYRKDELSNKKPMVGNVLGLAWTAVGGTTLEVQAITMEGKGNLILTGKLGEVMKESARVAHSYIRTIASKYDIDKKFYDNLDIHLHFPEGAVPKDGPSAGITITTAMLSALTNKPIRKDIAMTGEITILGNVLPVGGIKEKLIAALNVGVKEIILSVDNKKNFEELDEDIKKHLKVYFVGHYNEIEAILFRG